MPLPPRLLIAIIGAPHGVRGEVRVKSFAGEPAAMQNYGALQNEAGTRSFAIEALRPVKDDMCVVRFKGVSDRDAAAALTHTRLYALRANMPVMAPGEYYHADLVGLRAQSPDGAALGHVVAVQNFGAGDLIEIFVPGSIETLLLPFSNATVPQVDLAGGRIVVLLPVEVDGEDRATPGGD